MNKAITDGVLLMPPAFANGLDVWSRGDGTPGSDTYDGALSAVLVPADQDFGGCLELQKTDTTQKLRYMGETPLLPGCYLRVTARIKAVSGNLPTVRIAAYAGKAGGGPVGGVVTTGAETTLTSYGKVVEVSAIVGAGNRGGVDLVWGAEALYGHFGIDLTGLNGGVVRIDDIQIEDVTSVFLRDMLAMVDVRDHGAVGDGVTDDSAAFDAANAAADGRTVLIPEGTFFLGNDVTFDAPTRFEGKVTMPADKILFLRANYDYPHYLEAFEDEELAFKKAFQALLNNSDHESLDLCGRKIFVSEPIDMAAAVPNRDSYATRRVVRNGQFEQTGTTGWNTQVVTSQATYSTSDKRKLTGVINIANVPVGALVEGVGVGREIYVRDTDVATGEITLNAPLHDAEGTQIFTFRRFKYLIDFSGFSALSKFIFDSVEFQCASAASAIMLAPSGATFQLQDCFISRPKNRGATSIGTGCQGMLIDRCQFLSAEEALTVSARISVALNANANDIKLRNCRATKFRHFALLAGQNNLVIGNHFFQGDTTTDGVRTAGLILARTHTSSVLSGNYVDNCFIEWTNEQDSAPEHSSEFSFSSLSVTDNVFLSGDVAPWFNYIVVKPHGAGHFLNGVSVSGNRFRSINGAIDRVETVDTSFADLDHKRNKDVTFTGNSFHNVNEPVANPLAVIHDQNSPATTWVIDTGKGLPFGAELLMVDSVVPMGPITKSGGGGHFQVPYAGVQHGPAKDQAQLTWAEPVEGRVHVRVRMDN